MLIERFITVSNATLRLYYTMGTFNPYTVVKMRSEFTIRPVIDPASLVHKKNKVEFLLGRANERKLPGGLFTNLSSGWTTFPDIVTSTTGTFDFTNMQSGGLPGQAFYRLRTSP
jgi:hypothetical protein